MRNTFDFSTKGKYKALSMKLSSARFALLNYAIANPGCITKERALTVISEVVGDDAGCVLEFFIDKNIVGLNSDGDLEHLYPVSCVETPHRVLLEDGRSFYAMCAIDALGTAATFKMQAKISSYCKDTNDAVKVIVNTDGIAEVEPSNMYVSYYDVWSEKKSSFNY